MIGEMMVSTEFVDRYSQDPRNAVDVIIPIIHTTELWELNLKSIYREIPVNRLLISDGGCIDGSLEILAKFPRVEVLNHRDLKSLGFSLRKLIEAVQTDYFIYLHSDVYLPQGWFDSMLKDQTKYDWFESKHINSFFVELPFDYTKYERPLSGGQMGRRAAFEKVLPAIDDDYLYRNEDIIFAELIRRTGGNYGRSEDAHLYHQVMNKKSAWRRTITRFQISVDKSPEEEIREWNTQAKGLIKYLPPSELINSGVMYSINRLIELDQTTLEQFKEWVKTTPYADSWIKVINQRFSYKTRLINELRGMAQIVRDGLKQFVRVVRVGLGRV